MSRGNLNIDSSDQGRVNPLILVLLVSIIGLASMTCLMMFRLSTAQARPHPAPSAPATVGNPERARVIADFHHRHGDKVIDRIVTQAQKNPAYRRSLLAMTKEGVWAIKRLSLEEKTEMWERTQLIQQKLKTSNQ